VRHAFFAICPRGLEELLAKELAGCGASGCSVEAGGVAFSGSLRTGYAANLHSRLASRVLWQVAATEYATEDDLYAAGHDVAWEQWFGADMTLRVDVTTARSPLRSREFATLRIKDAIVDRLRDRTGSRPSIDREQPDVRVFVHVGSDSATFYLDLSGEALFKRGWRADKGEAPLKENLAAGLLALTGWTPDKPLLDPFCGSGTIVIEAASLAARRAPGIDRRFAFERLRTFARSEWRELLEDAHERLDRGARATLVGADISTGVIERARRNGALAGFEDWLADGRMRLEAGDARSFRPPAQHGVVLANPPYGEQSAPKSASVASLMGAFATNLKQHYAGWTAWLLSADLGLPGTMRLKESRRIVLYNGPLECRLFRFEVVAGSFRRDAARATPPSRAA